MATLFLPSERLIFIKSSISLITKRTIAETTVIVIGKRNPRSRKLKVMPPNFSCARYTNQPPPPPWPSCLFQLSLQARPVGVLGANQQKPLPPRSMIAGKYLVDIV